MDGFDVTWTDPNGKLWKLDGSQGVILDLDQEGFQWGAISHDFDTPAGVPYSRVDRAMMALKIQVGTGIQGSNFLNLYTEWWTQANSPFRWGTLSVRTQSGTRYKKLRLAESPETVFQYNPLMDQERPVEPWFLIGDAWWSPTEPVTTTVRQADFRSKVTPFYGPSGRGMPLHLSNLPSAVVPVVNRGQASAWPTYVLRGPLSDVQIGPNGSRIVIEGGIPSGVAVEISTAPKRRGAVSSSIPDISRRIGGDYAPLLPGSTDMHVTSRVVGSGASIDVRFLPQYALPF